MQQCEAMDYSSRIRRRPITPWVVVALTGIAIAGVQFSSIETDFRAYLTVPILLLMLLALGIWVLFFSGMPWRRRGIIVMGTIASLVALGFATSLLTRREGSYSGARRAAAGLAMDATSDRPCAAAAGWLTCRGDPGFRGWLG